MGQAFRRASGRIRTASLEPPSSSSSTVKKVAVDRPPPVPPPPTTVAGGTDFAGPGLESEPKVNTDNVLEERDSQYDAMLSQMVGRIKAKPGGKLEMGEASVVENYQRPLPKLRNTTAESNKYEERPTRPGTLNVTQLRHIMLLHEGKADDHNGPMDVHQIAEKYRLDITQIQKILHSVSLPPQDKSNKRDNGDD